MSQQRLHPCAVYQSFRTVLPFAHNQLNRRASSIMIEEGVYVVFARWERTDNAGLAEGGILVGRCDLGWMNNGMGKGRAR